jgi:cAMP phosphodiesterase
MKLRILGSAGGAGGREQGTTSLMVDNDILLDAGTGVCKLTLDQLSTIHHVFLSHSHIDHVVGLAFLLDAATLRKNPSITVHATNEVIETLKEHLFNWKLWPDFTVLPSKEKAVLKWSPMVPESTVEINDRFITSFPVNHTVNAVAYWVKSIKDGFLFTGDLTTTPNLWEHFKNKEKVSVVIVDCSFPNEECELAFKSQHYCPKTLIEDIQCMPSETDFLIYHLKPGAEDMIIQQLNQSTTHRFSPLQGDSIYDFNFNPPGIIKI